MISKRGSLCKYLIYNIEKIMFAKSFVVWEKSCTFALRLKTKKYS